MTRVFLDTSMLLSAHTLGGLTRDVVLWITGADLRWLAAMCALLLPAMASAQERAPELVILSNSTSPDGKLAVAVLGDRDAELVNGEEAAVLLVDAHTEGMVARLEEVDSWGGGWGRTTTNVTASWSANSKHLIVGWSFGRMSRDFVLFRMVAGKPLKVKLPDRKSHPKGEVFGLLSLSSNARAYAHWINATTFVDRTYGFSAKSDDDAAALTKLGFEDIDTTIGIVYKLKPDGKTWFIHDIVSPAPEPHAPKK